jgi:hypothetical protein
MVLLMALVTTLLIAAPADEYQTRQSALNRELAAEYCAMGAWCRDQNLLSEAREQFEHALALDPANAEAARKLAELTPVTRPTKEVNLKCEMHLVSGETVKADLLMDNFKIETPAGFLIVPAAEMDLIQMGTPQKPDVFFSDSYNGEGHLKAESFSVTGKFGHAEVKTGDVASLRVLRPCPVCAGHGEVKCPRCGGVGRLNEKSVCPTCNGKGTVKCATCDGTGKTVCPLCGGKGQFQGAWGGLRRVRCPRCQGTGKIACTDCQGTGHVVCPTCKGKPTNATAGECPVCNGRKVVPCNACGGTGVKPLPKTESDAEKKEEIKPEAVPVAVPAPAPVAAPAPAPPPGGDPAKKEEKKPEPPVPPPPEAKEQP